MKPDISQYTMVLPVLHFRLDERHAAVESAFAEHLRMMRNKIGPSTAKFVIASPAMAPATFETLKPGYSTIDEKQEGIFFEALYQDEEGAAFGRRLRLIPMVMRSILKQVKRSFCIHSGLSWNISLPFEFASILLAVARRRRTVFVIDNDYRGSAEMSFRTGEWSKKSYLLCKYLYDPVRTFQLWIAVRFCTLVLIKSKKMAADFGRGRPNVRVFLDASHRGSNLIDAGALARKLRDVRNPSLPLHAVYFGRFLAMKGIDHCIRAVAAAHSAGANIRLDIIGGGSEELPLKALARSLGTEPYIRFHEPRIFNQEFFEMLYRFHLLLAAPLREDTPRSALDAMAAGIPYLAYDTDYFHQLLESNAGETVPWLCTEAMAEALVALAANREKVATMIQNAAIFGRDNTQEVWLDRRIDWTMQSALGTTVESSI